MTDYQGCQEVQQGKDKSTDQLKASFVNYLCKISVKIVKIQFNSDQLKHKSSLQEFLLHIIRIFVQSKLYFKNEVRLCPDSTCMSNGHPCIF